MRRYKWYLLVALSGYLIALAWTAPVTLLVPRLMEEFAPQSPLALYPLDGSITNGRAEVYLDHHHLGRLEWQLNPLWLVTGQVVAALQLHTPAGDITTRGQLGLNQTIRLAKVSGSLPAAWLQPHLPPMVSGLPLAGQLQLDLDQLAWQPSGPASIQGRIWWKQAALGDTTPLALGELLLELTTDPQGAVHASLTDQGGPLKADGQASLQPNGQYRLDLTLAASGPGSAPLRQKLALVAKPDPQGNSRLQLSGRWHNNTHTTPPD